MQNIKSTSRELYNTLDDYSQFLVDEGYLTIIDGQLTSKPKEGIILSLQQLKEKYKLKLAKKR